MGDGDPKLPKNREPVTDSWASKIGVNSSSVGFLSGILDVEQQFLEETVLVFH